MTFCKNWAVVIKDEYCSSITQQDEIMFLHRNGVYFQDLMADKVNAMHSIFLTIFIDVLPSSVPSSVLYLDASDKSSFQYRPGLR